MNRRSLLTAATLLSAGLLGGCDPNMQQMATTVPASLPVRPPVGTCAFQVVNNSSLTVHQLYFSSSAQTSWGVDQLGTSVLPPGRAQSYRPNNPGNYDFRVIWTNGRTAELRQVNPCATSQVVVTNRGLVAR